MKKTDLQSQGLKCPAGEILVLFGSSGCGKTTTLKMVNRLIEPTEGIIEVNGKNVVEQAPVALRWRIGYVFQGIAGCRNERRHGGNKNGY